MVNFVDIQNSEISTKTVFGYTGVNFQPIPAYGGSISVAETVFDSYPGSRTLRNRWKGYGERHNRWRPYEDISPDTIKDYLQENGLWDYDWSHRCPNCDKPAKSATGVKIHQSRSRECKNMWTQRRQNFAGTEAERKAKEQQKEDQQKDRPTILCEGKPLKNCYLFKYFNDFTIR